jgi:hypothetical protein
VSDFISGILEHLGYTQWLSSKRAILRRTRSRKIFFRRASVDDGRVLQDLFEPAFIAQNPVRAAGSADSEGGQGAQYSAEESAIVEERLKALGYIE